MASKMVIREYWSGKKHFRTLKYCGSISYKVEGNYLVVRKYYDNTVVSKYNISKYGSIEYWAE